MNATLLAVSKKAMEERELTELQAEKLKAMPVHFRMFVAECNSYGARTRYAEEAGYFGFDSVDDARKSFNSDMKDLKDALGEPSSADELYKPFSTMRNSLTKAITRHYTVAETTGDSADGEDDEEQDTVTPSASEDQVEDLSHLSPDDAIDSLASFMTRYMIDTETEIDAMFPIVEEAWKKATKNTTR